jgi:pyruvate/2-oxoglutarate dehydrogenase complex dihydrolipoamide acyltransferase (E2) component
MSSSCARLILMLLAPAVLGLGVTACTQSAIPSPQTQGFTTQTPIRESAPPSSAPTGSATATAPASSPVSSPASSPTSSSTVTSTPRATILAMADGRYAARITAVDSHRRLVTVDVVQLFLGKAAATAAAQDHAERVPPPNDLWIRNQSHLLGTLSVTSTAPITVNDLGAVITHSSVKNLHVTLARLGQFPDLNGGIFWLTVRHGVVTQIAEQYLP